MLGKISKTTVDKLMPAERDVFLWDVETKGFGLKVTPAGKKSYVFQYRVPGKNAPERITIGPHGDPWTPDSARLEAERLRGKVASMRQQGGTSPRAEQKARAEVRRRLSVTMETVCKEYIDDGMPAKKRRKKKPTTVYVDTGRINRHIVPLLGKYIFSEITTDDVMQFFEDVKKGKTATEVVTKPRGIAKVTGGQGTAIRTVRLLGGIFSYGKRKKYRSDNPCEDFELPADGERNRPLTQAEFRRLDAALERAEAIGVNVFALCAIRILAFVGWRKSEVLGLEWSNLDLERKCMWVPDSKTGRRAVPLSGAAVKVFSRLRLLATGKYVFVGAGEDHFKGLQKIWEKVREMAKIEDVGLHDLRHTFATESADAGHSVAEIADQLGHRDIRTTLKYIHIADERRRAVANKTADRITQKMRGKKN